MFELKYVERREWERNDSYYEQEIYTIGGYTVMTTTETEEDGSVDHGISVRITDPTDENGVNKYLPDIYFNGRIGRKKAEFTIQTTSFGALNAKEYNDFLLAQHVALSVVDVLTKRFIDK